MSMRSTNRSVLSGDVCELLRGLNLVRRRRGCRGGRRWTTERRAGTSLYNIPVVVGPRTRCKRSYIEERPTALVRLAVQRSPDRSDTVLHHINSRRFLPTYYLPNPTIIAKNDTFNRIKADIASLSVDYGRTLSDASMLYFADVFFKSFFMRALVGQTAERIFTKLSHVVHIRCYLRTY